MDKVAGAAASISVDWQGGRRFEGGRADAPRITLDCDRVDGPGPVDTVLVALASCAAIDVVEILAKRRTPASALRIEIDHTRADQAPRRLTRVHLRFLVTTASERSHVERAVELATTRYCSVAASLDPDLPITTEVILGDVSQQRGTAADT